MLLSGPAGGPENGRGAIGVIRAIRDAKPFTNNALALPPSQTNPSDPPFPTTPLLR